MKIGALATLVLLCGCAMTSGVMEAEGGTYLISAHAAPVRGGATGANGLAYDEAQKFCAAKGQHAVVLTAQERDVYQGAWSVSGGSGGGGIFAAGNANLHFKCE